MTEFGSCWRCNVKTYFYDHNNGVWACTRHRVQGRMAGPTDLARSAMDAAVDRAWRERRRA